MVQNVYEESSVYVQLEEAFYEPFYTILNAGKLENMEKDAKNHIFTIKFQWLLECVIVMKSSDLKCLSICSL